jgi:hypothetical protein
MINGKAAGSDNIPVEILKVDPNVAADMLLPLFQDTVKCQYNEIVRVTKLYSL